MIGPARVGPDLVFRLLPVSQTAYHNDQIVYLPTKTRTRRMSCEFPVCGCLGGRSCLLSPLSSLAQDAPASTKRAADSTQPAVANFPPIDDRMDAFVREQEIAGAVTLVADAEKVLHVGAVGYAKLKDQSSQGYERMREDSIFWIASMSKPVTGVCVMQLVDQGKLSLDDPIDRHLPEMAAR